VARPPIELDALIVGGGVAGLMTLDAIHRRGGRAWLIERDALGRGQTVWSQGIIHGGLKYALGGSTGAAARAVSDMPARWRAMLDGDREPNLSAVQMRADRCAVWAAAGARSMAGLLGAKLALRTRPRRWPDDARPQPLQGIPGMVLSVAEPVLEPTSLLQTLAHHHAGRLLRGEVAGIDASPDGAAVTLQGGLVIRAAYAVLLAGEGNGQLRQLAGLSEAAMQTRPLRMVLARGPLPILNGHCIRGTSPWLTITTAAGDGGERVWQIGGEVAEWGAGETAAATIRRAISDVRDALPSTDLAGTSWSTYEAPRAERAASDGGRPDQPGLIQDGRVLTGWPTKLALAPILADSIAALIPSGGEAPPVDEQLPSPVPAPPPWMENRTWTPVHSAAPA
jgi:glycine/D-amino acid oxidase-like deaminating enzyme